MRAIEKNNAHICRSLHCIVWPHTGIDVSVLDGRRECSECRL